MRSIAGFNECWLRGRYIIAEVIEAPQVIEGPPVIEGLIIICIGYVFRFKKGFMI